MFQFEFNECASDHYTSDYKPFTPSASAGVSSGRLSLGTASSGSGSNKINEFN